jgi:hypothetical protein
MRVEVKKEFADKYTHQMYKVGSVIEFADERAKDLIGRELALAVDIPKPKETAAKSIKKVTKPSKKVAKED